MAKRAIKNKSAKEAKVRKPVDLPETPNSLSERAELLTTKLITRRIINAITNLLGKSSLFLFRKPRLEKRSAIATTRTRVNILGALTGS